MKRLPFILAVFAAGLCTAAICRAAEQPKHLAAAVDLVDRLDLQNTSYRHGEPQVTWQGDIQSHADCSGFLDALLMHSYGYSKDDFKRWFDSHRPSARRYHDAIVGQRGFREIRQLAEVQPGDILAVKYLNRTDNTGHVMLVADRPRRIAPTQPIVAGTEQWEVPVIDSSHSGHGPTDTRHHRGPNGKDHDGLGRGVFRIYSGMEGQVVGFSWSTSKGFQVCRPRRRTLGNRPVDPGIQAMMGRERNRQRSGENSLEIFQIGLDRMGLLLSAEVISTAATNVAQGFAIPAPGPLRAAKPSCIAA